MVLEISSWVKHGVLANTWRYARILDTVLEGLSLFYQRKVDRVSFLLSYTQTTKYK